MKGVYIVTPREDSSTLIEAVLAGCTLTETAQLTGQSLSTVQRRLRNPDVIAEIQDARAHRHREFVGRINRGVLPAVDQLIEHVHSADPAISLRAIDLMLRNSARWAMVVDVEDRLAAIESRLTPPPDGEP
jgi:hypothetical protein